MDECVTKTTISLWMGSTQGSNLHASGPGRLQQGDLTIDRAIRVVRPRQVAAADQELLDDLPAGKNKGFLEELCPAFQAERMVHIQPADFGVLTRAWAGRTVLQWEDYRHGLIIRLP